MQQYTQEQWNQFYQWQFMAQQMGWQAPQGWQVPQFGQQQPVPPGADIMDVGQYSSNINQLQRQINQVKKSGNVKEMTGLRNHLFNKYANQWGRDRVAQMDIKKKLEERRKEKIDLRKRAAINKAGAFKKPPRRQILNQQPPGQQQQPRRQLVPRRQSAVEAESKIAHHQYDARAERKRSELRRERQTTQPENMDG